jgi:glycine/D-amino acid oxidase-like deaminating enzyme/nitrite reductase/ring-hydroxylating ferredoxin subunit
VGITTAYLLTQAGLKVVLAEAGRILQGTTGHTTAKITSQHELIYSKISQQMSRELARLYADANEHAIGQIKNIIDENHIECDFVSRPAYIYTQSNDYVKQIEEETRAAASLGIKAEYLEEIPLPFTIKAALRFDNQAQFHPLKYLHPLADLVVAGKGHIFENTEALDIAQSSSRLTIETRNGSKITADKVIVATHFPFFDGGGLYFARIYQEKSYVVAAQIQETFPHGMFISAEDPGRSLRSQKFGDSELVLFGGEHHRSGHGENTNIHYQNLLQFARDTFTVDKVLYRWSTQYCVTMDGLPYVGNLTSRSPNVYVATGFGKWGMTNGTAAAVILKDLITTGDNPWAQVYNPSRAWLNSTNLKTLIVQNAIVAKDLLTGKLGSLPDHAELERGQAEIVDHEGNRIGVYRDEKDQYHIVDTTCTHLGCELVWNSAEKTWDCPCHGSRFSAVGEVVEGPAINRLTCDSHERNKVEAKIFH